MVTFTPKQGHDDAIRALLGEEQRRVIEQRNTGAPEQLYLHGPGRAWLVLVTNCAAGDRLPPIVSGHNTYYLWGPGSISGAMMIVGYDDPGELRPFFRDPVQPIATAWPRVKHYT